MKRILTTVAAAVLLAVLGQSDSAAQKVKASPNNVDCSTWSMVRAERKFGEVQPVAAFVHGLITGMAIGADIEFWKTGGKEIKPHEVFDWMDKYCSENPQSSGFAGAVVLMNGRTNNAWKSKFGTQ